ncbi:bifunctional 2-polyprenyl-6-hydroxyphenol methylase/3-demethylubiquinol 3-O-methyltransferase UbiG [Sphingomonas jejuensis]
MASTAPGALDQSLPTLSGTTIDPREAAHFGAMASDWWDPAGRSAMLHRLNPPRLRYIRDQVDRHWQLDPRVRRPLDGRRALDLGCGGGLLAEPLARLGAAVTAVDAAAEAVAVARDHAAAQGLQIDYRAGGVEQLAGETFDLVCSLEVIEHAADQPGFVRGLAATLAPGGLMILSTPNRTALSRLAIVTLAESTGAIPRGTHDWNRFLTPDDLAAMVNGAGLRVVDICGIAASPTRGFRLSEDLSLDYLLTATWA